MRKFKMLIIMKKQILFGLIALLLAMPFASAQITTEVECKERQWFWYDYTCHEHEVQEAFDEVTGYINENEGGWLSDRVGTSFEYVLSYLETTFWAQINELIDNKLDEREARMKLGWTASDFSVGLEATRIKAQRLHSFEKYGIYNCDPEGMCTSLTINA